MSALSQQSEKGTQIPPNIRNQLMIWLLIVVMMIFCMVIIGGITRLTGSGLSMVEWRPLMGTLPPLSDLEWARVFKLYQASPQYQQVNDWMTLSDFKWIFFWEYLHRLFGRLIGLVFALPWLYFLIKGALKGTWLWRSTAALLLGGSQGLLGWYMVKSGLVDMPQVSHFPFSRSLMLGLLLWSMGVVNADRSKAFTNGYKAPKKRSVEQSFNVYIFRHTHRSNCIWCFYGRKPCWLSLYHLSNNERSLACPKLV